MEDSYSESYNGSDGEENSNQINKRNVDDNGSGNESEETSTSDESSRESGESSRNDENSHESSESSANDGSSYESESSDVSNESSDQDDNSGDKSLDESAKNTSTKNHSYERSFTKCTSEFAKKTPIIPKSDEGGKWYAKENSCPYCDKSFMRLDRHLLRAHKDKRTVKKILSLEKKSKLRLGLFELLTNIGNERFNKDSERNPEKRLRVKRRLAKNVGKTVPYLKNEQQKKMDDKLVEKTDKTIATKKKGKKQKNSKKKEKKKKKSKKSSKKKSKSKKKRYSRKRVICPVCRGYYSSNTYSQHFSSRHGDMICPNTREILKTARRELSEYHPDASVELIRYILPYLTNDHIGLMCRYDKLVILYGNKYIEQYESDDQAKLVRGHMRLMCRVLWEMKNLDGSIEDLESVFQPGYFNSFILAAQKICKTKKKILAVPYNGHSIRMLWNRLICILNAEYSRIADHDKRRELKGILNDYQAVFANEYLSKIGSKAQRAQNISRRIKSVNANRVDADDVKIYFKYLIINRDKYLEDLTDKFDTVNYFKLLNYQVVLLMIFNGRRPGETERTRLENYYNRQKPEEDDEFFRKLSSNEKRQAMKYQKIICQGKKINGIDCTIYVTATDIEALDLLIKYRSKARVQSDNHYLFAYPSEDKGFRMRHVEAGLTNARLVKDCHKNYRALKKPEFLRSTKCRIQIATTFSAIGDPKQLDNITNHLAHTKGVHFSNYRKSIVNTDVNVTAFLEKRLDRSVTDESMADDSTTPEDFSITPENKSGTTAPHKTYKRIMQIQNSVSDIEEPMSEPIYIQKSQNKSTVIDDAATPENFSIAPEKITDTVAPHKTYKRIVQIQNSDSDLSPVAQQICTQKVWNNSTPLKGSSTEPQKEDNIIQNPIFKKIIRDSAVKIMKTAEKVKKPHKSPSRLIEQNYGRHGNQENESESLIKNPLKETSSQLPLRTKKRRRVSSTTNKLDAPKMKKKKIAKIAPKKSDSNQLARRGRGICWTEEEKTAFNTAFSRQLSRGKNATATEIRTALENFPILRQKNEATIRARFSNIYLKQRNQISLH